MISQERIIMLITEGIITKELQIHHIFLDKTVSDYQ